MPIQFQVFFIYFSFYIDMMGFFFKVNNTYPLAINISAHAHTWMTE